MLGGVFWGIRFLQLTEMTKYPIEFAIIPLIIRPFAFAYKAGGIFSACVSRGLSQMPSLEDNASNRAA